MNARNFLVVVLLFGVVYGLVNFMKNNDFIDLFSLFFVGLSVVGLLVLYAVAKEDAK